MKIGTRSLLFGVHQFLWHPWCVARAWRLLYQRWPRPMECLAILLHDIGYWGCPDMDGPCGKDHPRRGADYAASVHYWLMRWCGADETVAIIYASGAWELVAGHSATFSKRAGIPLSRLYAADKVAALMEPPWFYLLRAWMSGEGREFESNSPVAGLGLRTWFRWYRNFVSENHFNVR